MALTSQEHVFYYRHRAHRSQPTPMSLSQFIRDNTSDGRNIALVLIDVMEGRLDGTRISHRLTAARLLTIYGYDDAPDFISDNTPDTPETESGKKIWFEIDPGLRTLIKARTDDGRVICMFLIDVMGGRIEGVHVGHRVNAAKELLDCAFGKSRRPRLRPQRLPLLTHVPLTKEGRPWEGRPVSVVGLRSVSRS